MSGSSDKGKYAFLLDRSESSNMSINAGDDQDYNSIYSKETEKVEGCQTPPSPTSSYGLRSFRWFPI